MKQKPDPKLRGQTQHVAHLDVHQLYRYYYDSVGPAAQAIDLHTELPIAVLKLP